MTQSDAAEPIQLSYISLAGSEVPSPTRENAHLLQHVADYQTSARNLRLSGIGDVIWGLINSGIGLTLVNRGTAAALIIGGGLMLLGSLLLGVGLWIIIKPTPIGTIIDGVALLVVALWNGALAVLIMAVNPATPPVVPIVLCISQIGWGIHRILRYPRFASAVAMQPSAAAVKRLADLASQMLKAKPRDDAQMLQFTRKSSLAVEKWKARLMPEVGIFVGQTTGFFGRRDIAVATPEGMEILNPKKTCSPAIIASGSASRTGR
jgi:hypothetical protein